MSPGQIGLQLDEHGWAEVDELLRLINRTRPGISFTREILDQVVATNEKQRFAFNDDKSRVRASQGHSVTINLALPPAVPPALLYHGTATRFLDSIRRAGLHSGSRQHVHLSLNVETATNVGQRHGKPAILQVRAGDMHAAGHLFYLSANGVWLTGNVPVEFLQFPE